MNRRFLYAGLFLVALGGVLVAADLTTIDTATLANALRLWPLAWIAIGAGVALRRSRFALVAGVLAAMIPGLVLGGFAVAPRHAVDCGTGTELPTTQTREGTFSQPASVAVNVTCGSISIGTKVGNAWQLTTANSTGREPVVESDNGRLEVRSTGGEDWAWLDEGRDTWTLTLATSQLNQADIDVAAGRATIALPQANIGVLHVGGAAADVVVDASQATVAEIDGSLEFGRLSIQLPQHGGYSGAIRMGAGELRLCVPYGLGLHVDFAGSPREVRVNGLRTDGRSWENDIYQATANRADLSVKVTFGSVAINPVLGGCK